MKKLSLLLCCIYFTNIAAQDHFSGLNTSSKLGFLSAGTNPAELFNMSSKYEINLFALSINTSNNKIGFKDIVNSDSDIQDLIFTGTEPINLRIDAEIYGPAFAMKLDKWAFGVTTKSYIKANLIDIDAQLGKAIIDAKNNALISATQLNNDYNQRINATTWGEVGFTIARNLLNTEKQRFSTGASIKLLFPGAYANAGIDKFQGKINYQLNGSTTTAYLNGINTQMNIAYSDNIANLSNFSNSILGKMNGIAVDFGLNYQLNCQEDCGYLLNTGLSIKNMGAMTFKDENNSSSNYSFVIPSYTPLNPGLNLNQFENVDGLKDAENILVSSGYLTKKSSESDFKVKLPTVVTFYADVKLIPKFYVSLYTKQKLGDDNSNDQVTTQNTTAITPRFSVRNFDIYSSWAKNEISGVTGGLGFRVYGLYVGSSSIVTALASDTKQADVYFGYRIALR